MIELSNFFLYATLTSIFIASFLITLEQTGLICYLPFLKKLYAAKEKRIIEGVLSEIGVKKMLSSAVAASQIKDTMLYDSISVDKALREAAIKGSFKVGKTNPFVTNTFWDVIGHSCDPDKSKLYATFLASYWKKLTLEQAVEQEKIDFVVTPKEGSPILGYEFSKRLGVPLVLYSTTPKFLYNEPLDSKSRLISFSEHFDSASMPGEGQTCLIVDDSTTGGRKINEMVSRLRVLKYNVSDCLVLFEPLGKRPGARDVLQSINVKLHRVTIKR